MKNVQLLYVSKTAPAVDRAAIDGIVRTAIAFNKTANITGILLYRDGIFLQLLEGDAAAISSLFARIEKDPRHSNVTKLFEIECKNRIFSHWAMAFSALKESDIKLISEVLSWNKLISSANEIDSHLILHMLKRFKEARLDGAGAS